MKLFICIVVLPCILAAEIACPDGTKCPLDKTCCSLSGDSFKCCDIQESKMQKRVLPGVESVVMFNNTSNSPELHAGWCQVGVTCQGTCCGPDHCCPAFGATCCSKPDYVCCPIGYSTCCSDSRYCCKRGQRCIGNGLCMNGAAFHIPSYIFLLAVMLASAASRHYFF